MNAKHSLFIFLLGLVPASAHALTLAQGPLYLSHNGTPLIMLTMERDHKLYYEAYNDASDINGDGVLDIRYNPGITYFGYFDSYKCYTYGSGKFSPSTITVNKQCSGAWSGDYLNYLTTSRMDALRRVLYGGKRSTDTDPATVLERSFIPQDAHSWGKEYTREDLDGYDISDYTPLAQPAAGSRHIFANTTLYNTTDPLLRVLQNSNFRVWEWLSIERPVAGTQCATGNNSRSDCAIAGSTNWEKVPSSYFSNLTIKTYNTTGYGTNYPNSTSDFDTLFANYSSALFGSTSASNIDCNSNNSQCNVNSAASGAQENYLAIISGNLVIPAGMGGSFTFAVDGDDAQEVKIDGNVVASYYGGHAFCNCQSHSGTINLSAGTHTIVYRMQEAQGGDGYTLWWQRSTSASTMTDYVVRVDACVSGLLENECRGYPNDNPTKYKPAGILQQYGETNRMAFGLITGSYAKNVSGGVLRKNISSLTDEIDSATGQFTATNGIIKTIDALKIVGFGGSYSYDQNCQVPEVGGPLAEGRCRMWGNPTAEIMYEGLRYFAGKGSPTTDYSIASSGNDDSGLGLPLPAWQDPYRSLASGGFPECSKPSLFVISDINPNFDTNQLPNRHSYTSPSATSSFTGDITGMNVESLANTIWNGEYGSPASLFIGQSDSNTPSYDGAPTAKTVTSFGNMRGLSPEEPTQEGGYYAASVALFGKTHDLNTADGNQKTDTFSVALASPLPRISFPLNKHVITLVPFAKTVGGCGPSAAQGSYQPTNTIVDFYVDTIKNTDLSNTDATINNGRPYAKFRINFEDSEYGSDHDMDAITEYELIAKADNTLDIKLSSNYAAGGCIQHMGYVISGTSTDGIYLEVRDPDTDAGSDVDYYLDTPHNRGSGVALPTSTTRNFSVGTNTSAAFVQHDPLWYAAKWGGFIDSNNNNILDPSEWDSRDGADGIPDSYFLVTNASKLKEQLDRAFIEILARDSSASAVATNSTSLKTQSRVYQARFNSLDWSGQLLSYQLSKNGVLSSTPEWDAGKHINDLNPFTDRVIITKAGSDGVAFAYANLTASQKILLDTNSSGNVDNCGQERVDYLRGVETHEASNGKFICASTKETDNFRERLTSKLGDIINSNPWFVGAPSAGYSDVNNPGYNAFRISKKSRKPVVYSAGNDGMLHGFDASLNVSSVPTGVPTATSGDEVLAYIPSPVFPNLTKLTTQTYNLNHLYFVDGSPMIADAFVSSSWRTVLIGSMAAGGKGYYALDVTDPSQFTEANAANILLWEFNDTDDADMGFAFNLPTTNSDTAQAKQIIKLANGKWAAIVGNGYNSSSGKAVLYILFIEDGIDGNWNLGDFVKIVVDAPTANDNGLSTPVPFDSNDDGYADTIYAGDLKGNMWKFLVGPNPSDSSVTNDPSTWKLAFSSATCANLTPSTCNPLFKAINNSGFTQPIIWPPEVTLHPDSGQLVLFGTGKYIEAADNTDFKAQTFYGIWDRHNANLLGTPVASRDTDLLPQTVTESALAGGNFRLPTSHPINWRPAPPATFNAANCSGACTPTHMGWYMDLPIAGERITGVPKLVNKAIFFNTLIPSSTLCSTGTGWLMALDYASGGAVPSRQIFDTGGNGNFNNDDTHAGGYEVGLALGGTTLIENFNDTSSNIGVGVSSVISGNLNTVRLNLGTASKSRLSWREIMQ
ncbi:MAG: PilC/PilY family type IV pilus protein [Methylovulum sp.]|nr:PilC/PilY family type IV pilus protein [Methylovulum sp.]